MGNNTNSFYRTVRGYQLANQHADQLTSALEDYLEMAYRLCMINEYTRIGKLSELLHVKPSSTSKMIFKLADLGYVKYDRYEIIQLTEKGRKTGEYLLNRHETVERFLKLIGSPNPLEETELIEHSLCPSTISDLAALLDFFEENPEARDAFSEYRESKGE